MVRTAGILISVSLGLPLFGGDPTPQINAARSAKNNHNIPAAAAAYDSALEIALAEPGRRLSGTAVEVATFYLQQNNAEKAEAALKRTIDQEDSAHVAPINEATVFIRLAEVYSQQRRWNDAASAQKRLTEVWAASIAPDAVVVANSLDRLARTQLETRDFAGARDSMNRALEILQAKYGDTAPTAYALTTLALAEQGLGDIAAEKAAVDRAMAITHIQSSRTVSAKVSPPSVISRKNPEYSEEARKALIQGTIDVSAVVDEKGEPQDVRLLIPLGAGLDEKAIEAVKAWRFQPGERDGVPVQVRVTVQINMRLL